MGVEQRTLPFTLGDYGALLSLARCVPAYVDVGIFFIAFMISTVFLEAGLQSHA
jgi:hypothetical protein